MENFQEKIRVFFSERDRKTLLYEVGVGFGVVVVCKVSHFLLKNTLLHPIPTFEFPLSRDDDFKAIKKGLDERKLPKVFRPKIFPGSTFSDILILTDWTDMDPRKVFMNASINVTSGFAFEKNYDFEDEEFQKLAEYINEFFKGLTHKSLQQMTWNILPRWICESDFYAKIWYKTPMKHFLDAVPPFHKFIYTMIKEQRKSLDHANPRNYLETLLIDAESDPKWGYFTVVATIVGVFLGASDTLANTMTWLALVLADHPEVQEKMNNEIKAAREIDADLKKENCPFTRSVLLESRRLNSVSDTLPHIVSEDITVKGFHIPRNSQIFGSLAAVMREPKNFDNPSKFIPDRFIKDGRFENDPKVCGFSVGLRNCIGKSLAIEEYFAFATAMVENFRIIRVAGNMELAKHGFLRLPKDDIRVQFVRR